MKRVLLSLAAVAVVGIAPPAAAAPSHGMQRTLDALVEQDGFPGALAAVRDGRTRDYTAGAHVPTNGRVRLASNTKMFTATVVLQLVGEGKVGLDTTVETYLPGVVRGPGGDGRAITVRQLLQQTSGLPDYDDALITDYFAVQHTYFEPRELLDAALARPSTGQGWAYSNTNYIVAGLIVQRVTGRPVGEEITKRIIERLGLRDTYWPAQGEQEIKGRHPRGYWPAENGDLVDVTTQDPSLGWAAGQLVGTPRDLNTFMTALMGGRLLPPDLLAQMKTTVPAPDFDIRGTAQYGLGIATFELSCGGVAWNHGGVAPGHVSSHGITEDGRAATVVVTANPTTLAAAEHIEDAVDTALCS